jgi:hypothetical protein
VTTPEKEPPWPTGESDNGKRPFTRDNFFRDLKKAARRLESSQNGAKEKARQTPKK